MASSNEYFTPERVDEQIEQLQQTGDQDKAPDEAHLVHILQRHYQVPLFAEDRAALEHARQRITDKQRNGETLHGDAPVITPPHTQPVTYRRRTRLMRVLSSLAAIIVVGALVGSWFAVTHMIGTPPTASSVGPSDLYVIQNGVAYRLDGRNGKVIWQDRLATGKQFGRAYVQVVNGVVYAVLHADVYAMNAGNGRQIWHVTNPSGKDYFWFVVDHGGVYLYALDSTFSALSAADGSELWHNTTFTTTNGYGFSVLDGNVYTRNSGGNVGDQKLYTLDGATGQVRWSVSLPQGSLAVEPQVENGVVYFAAGNRFYAVREQSGERIWEQTIPGGAFETELVGGILYVNGPAAVAFPATASSSDIGTISALDARSGRRLWTSNPGYNTLNLPLTQGRLLAARQHGGISSIVGLDPRTGHMAWQVPLQCAANASGYPICSGLWTAVINGKLYLLEPTSQAQSKPVYTLKSLNPASGQLLSEQLLAIKQGQAAAIGASNGLLYVQVSVSKTAHGIPYADYLFAAYRLSDGSLAWSRAMPPFPPPTSANGVPNTSQPVLAP